MKTLQEKVAKKLIAVRAKILKGNKHISNRSVQLAGDILLDLGFAARDGRLASTFMRSFLFTDRSEILCQMLQKADAALKANNTRFGLKRASWGLSDEEMWLRKNILRLTMEEILEEYGIEHYHICGKKIYPQDVLYARFLNEHGLGTPERG